MRLTTKPGAFFTVMGLLPKRVANSCTAAWVVVLQIIHLLDQEHQVKVMLVVQELIVQLHTELVVVEVLVQ